jgi:hypothetical protein
MSEASDEENTPAVDESVGRSSARSSRMVEEAKAYSAGLAKRGVVRLPVLFIIAPLRVSSCLCFHLDLPGENSAFYEGK